MIVCCWLNYQALVPFQLYSSKEKEERGKERGKRLQKLRHGYLRGLLVGIEKVLTVQLLASMPGGCFRNTCTREKARIPKSSKSSPIIPTGSWIRHPEIEICMYIRLQGEGAGGKDPISPKSLPKL